MKISGRSKGIKRLMSTHVLVLMPICVGFNLVGGAIAGTLKLPFFLDVIGTILAAVMAGPLVGGVVGLLTNVFLALMVNPVNLPYGAVSVSVGVVTGLFGKRGFFKPRGLVVIWLVVSLISAIVTSLVTVYLFGGATGATGTSVITAGLITVMKNIWQGVLTAAIVQNLVDRGISLVMAYLIIKKIPPRFLQQLGNGL